eukprot:TRINITY_DN24095_c0_g1_i1.p1 TRINITY_DN24095_c0_g1~~TRINITY_DN24095_c0_g1_i1.p1  ORF type:complete len:1117 (+),score=192.80 TRINITY_DN24095_c0_g1_i1:107-3457(+)
MVVRLIYFCLLPNLFAHAQLREVLEAVRHPPGQCWGSIQPEMAAFPCSHLNLGNLTRVYVGFLFGVVWNPDTGDGHCWGYSVNGGYCPDLPFKGLESVHDTWDIIAGHYRDGSIRCWGDRLFGEGVDDCNARNMTAMSHVVVNEEALVAWNPKRRQGQCWGVEDSGGNCSHINFTGVDEVIPTQYAFAALNRAEGAVQCWGHAAYGGNCSDVTIKGVDKVIPNHAAYVALDLDEGLGDCWGYDYYGGSCDDIDFSGVDEVVLSDSTSFVAVNRRDKSLQCWGLSAGLACQSIPINGTETFYSYDGTLVVYDKDAGRGRCYAGAAEKSCDHVNWTGVETVVTNIEDGWIALAGDGRVQCWGDPIHGGNCTHLEGFVAARVVATYAAFVAISNDGQGRCWGAWYQGGECDEIDFSGVHPDDLVTRPGNDGFNVGLFHSGKMCPTGMYKTWGNISTPCQRCPPGHVPSMDRRSCTPCKRNYIAKVFFCEECEDGLMQNEEQSRCIPCAAGQVSRHGKDCHFCEPGLYADETRTMCIPCPSGTYRTAEGQQSCSPCEPGYIALSGQPQCSPCPDNYEPDEGQATCRRCPKTFFAEPGDVACQKCRFPSRMIANECSTNHVPVVVVFAGICFTAIIYVTKRIREKKLREFLDQAMQQCDWNSLYRLRAHYYAIKWKKMRILHDHLTCRTGRRRLVKAYIRKAARQSQQLGVSLEWVLTDFYKQFQDRAARIEWRSYKGTEFTRLGYANRFRDDPPVSWDCLEVCEFPANPNFHQMAPVLSFGEYGLGHSRTCPRDGDMHCSIVDALLPTKGSAKADWFISWVWQYDMAMIIDALGAWWRGLQMKSSKSMTTGDVHIWWCFFVNNQYRLQEEQPNTAELCSIFGERLKDVGRMLICFDTLSNPSYVTRMWCIFEVFVACQNLIPCTIIFPPNEDGKIDIDDQAPIASLMDACKIDVANAKATVKADEDAIKALILEKMKSFSYVNDTVERAILSEAVIAVRAARTRNDQRVRLSANYSTVSRALGLLTGSRSKTEALTNQDQDDREETKTEKVKSEGGAVASGQRAVDSSEPPQKKKTATFAAGQGGGLEALIDVQPESEEEAPGLLTSSIEGAPGHRILAL